MDTEQGMRYKFKHLPSISTRTCPAPNGALAGLQSTTAHKHRKPVDLSQFSFWQLKVCSLCVLTAPFDSHVSLCQEFLDRRKMTEFGSLALVDEGAGDGDGVELRLPGVRRGDMSSRHFKPEIRVTSLHFSPTGRSWATASMEGLLVYSLDTSLVFDPYDLDMDVTPVSVRHQLKKKEWTSAIVLAFHLNGTSLIREVLESVPYNQTELVSSSLPDVYVEKLLDFVASSLEKSRHLQFYLTWAQNLLTLHGQKLKSRSSAILTTIQQLLKSIQRHHDYLSKLCDWNIYTIRYTAALAKQRGMKRTATDCLVDEEVDEAEVMDSEDEEEDMSDPVIVES
ncbi:periodic tryptophan protein 2 homolog [Electrophorus electricus]|uniref:periodic tryptophan protein 2 homolog n=1 Tax=Electrophorus electricus TaxID=8005 RepID=UPI0015D007BE|nr:periodic tryptophan protein 2 homolog [Electrophorus electricus]